MRSDIHRKIELATNIATMIVAALLCIVLVKNYLIPHSASTTASVANSNQEQLQAGAKLSISGIDWKENDQTLILALSTTCHYCSESAPFYQRLIKERGSNTRIVAVLPQPSSEGQDYLNKLGVAVDEIQQASLKSINVRGTPTLMLVNGDGVVVRQWLGKLPVDQEAEVLSRVQSDRARK